MTEKIKLSGVPETMLQTLYVRAKESSGRGAIRDRKAEELIGKLDYDFSLADRDPAMHSGVIARTIVLDRLVDAWLAQHPGAVVVNIACGLDTRCYRMHGYTHWYNLDLPQTMAVRERLLPESGVVSQISMSAMADWGGEIAAHDAPALVIIEELIGQIFAGTKYRVTYEPNMGDFLLCHAAFVLPAAFACYKTDGNLKKLKKDDAYLNRMIDANIEGYRALRNAGHGILPKADTNFESAAYRKTCFRFFKLICATSLGKICVSDHAMNAADEMSALNRDLKRFFDETGAAYPVWQALEQESGTYLK